LGKTYSSMAGTMTLRPQDLTPQRLVIFGRFHVTPKLGSLWQSIRQYPWLFLALSLPIFIYGYQVSKALIGAKLDNPGLGLLRYGGQTLAWWLAISALTTRRLRARQEFYAPTRHSQAQFLAYSYIRIYLAWLLALAAALLVDLANLLHAKMPFWLFGAAELLLIGLGLLFSWLLTNWLWRMVRDSPNQRRDSLAAWFRQRSVAWRAKLDFRLAIYSTHPLVFGLPLLVFSLVFWLYAPGLTGSGQRQDDILTILTVGWGAIIGVFWSESHSVVPYFFLRVANAKFGDFLKMYLTPFGLMTVIVWIGLLPWSTLSWLTLVRTTVLLGSLTGWWFFYWLQVGKPGPLQAIGFIVINYGLFGFTQSGWPLVCLAAGLATTIQAVLFRWRFYHQSVQEWEP
jgi:hypothetical protein